MRDILGLKRRAGDVVPVGGCQYVMAVGCEMHQGRNNGRGSWQRGDMGG